MPVSGRCHTVTAEELGEIGARQIINPTGWIGFHYLCGKCSKKTLFDKEKGLLKKEIKNSASETQEEASVLDESHVPPSQLGNDTVPSSDNPEAQPEAEDSNEDVFKDCNDEDDDTETVINMNTQNDKKAKSSKICKFYKQATCKHGVRGRNCKFDHPVACKKLLTHGNRSPDGCTLGEKCEKYHLRMCPSSLKKKECYRATCKLVHVKGTKRKKADTENKNEKRSSSSHDTQGTAQSARAKAANQNPFLEALQAMRNDILKELDQRLAALQPKSYMSLNQKNNIPAQGAVQGQQVVLVPMHIPN